MKHYLGIIVALNTYSFFAQQIHVFSAKDSLRVPFATLIVKNEHYNFGKTGNDEGIIELSKKFDDTCHYTLTIHSFGFEKYTGLYLGAQINKLGNVYLSPANMNLDEIVITAQYEPTHADQSVQKIRIIGKEKIQQMGAVNLRDVLSNQLNVRLSQDNILGSGMNLQGIKGENVKILVDGVPVIGRLDGNIDLSQINMNNVDRIELIEGPLSVQYGTNALAGTINIITKKAAGGRYALGINPYYESIGTYNVTGDIEFSKNKHSIQVNGGRNYFDGWNGGDPLFTWPRSQPADSSRFKQWKPKEQYFAGASYHYAFRGADLGIKSAYFREAIYNRGYPRAPYGESAFDDYYYTRRVDNSLSFKAKLSSAWSINTLSGFNYYNRIKKTVYRDLTTLKDTLSGNSSDQDTSSFTLVMSRASFIHALPEAKLDYELGYDVNYESAYGKRIDKKTQYMGDYAVFITAGYKPFSDLIIKPGLRYAYNTAYQTPLIPSLNLKWAVSENHAFRMSYARGFRAPTIKELYFLFVDVNHNIVGNDQLTSERSHNYALSYNYNRDIRRCRVRLDISTFYNSIFNLINLAQVSGTEYAYVNIGRYKTTGIQVEGSFTFKRFFLQTGVNYTGRYNQLSESADIPGFNYSPEVVTNLGYKLPAIKATVSVFFKHTGRLPGYMLVDETVHQTSVEAYTIMDASFGKFFRGDRIQLNVGCKNVFNVTSVNSIAASGVAHGSSASSMPLSTGRNYFVKISFHFSRS